MAEGAYPSWLPWCTWATGEAEAGGTAELRNSKTIYWPPVSVKAEGGEGEGKWGEEKRQKFTPCHSALFQTVCVKECQHLNVAIFPRRSRKESEGRRSLTQVTGSHTQAQEAGCTLPGCLSFVATALSRHSGCFPQHGHPTHLPTFSEATDFPNVSFKTKTSYVVGPLKHPGGLWLRLERAITEEWFPGNQLPVEQPEMGRVPPGHWGRTDVTQQSLQQTSLFSRTMLSTD